MTFLVFSWIPPALRKLAEVLFNRTPDWYSDAVRVIEGSMLYTKLLFCMVWAWASFGGTLAIQYTKYEQDGRTINTRPDYFTTIDHIIKSLFASSVIVLAEKIVLQLTILHFHKASLRERLDRSREAVSYTHLTLPTNREW